MKLTGTLLVPVLALLTAAAFAIVAIKFTFDQAQAAGARYTAQQTQQREAQTRVQKSGSEKQLIEQYLPNYRKLEALGFAGGEQRINWLDGLRSANQKAGLFGVNYEIAARQAYPQAALFAPGPMSIMHSMMKLRLPLLHEEDLPKFLAYLEEQHAGVFLTDQCTLRRAPQTQTQRYQPNMTAECQLAWITTQPSSQAEVRP